LKKAEQSEEAGAQKGEGIKRKGKRVGRRAGGERGEIGGGREGVQKEKVRGIFGMHCVWQLGSRKEGCE